MTTKDTKRRMIRTESQYERLHSPTKALIPEYGSDRSEGSEITLRLRPLASEIPAAIRLRRLLKAALRAYAFRATEISQIGTAQASEGAEPMVAPLERPTRETGGDCEATQ
jgi:hypothetical protein